MRRTLILTAVIFGMTGCPEGDQPPQPNPTEEMLRREREQRMQLEASKEHWQTLATVAVIAAVVLLIAGVILGSKARSDAGRRK
jgi:hypothetical protein